MKDILTEIIQHKQGELARQKAILSLEQLQDNVDPCNPTHSMKQALLNSSSGIIAEFKRRSPSKGWINEHARPEIIVPHYLHAGATALSILTDDAFFGGSLRDIRKVRTAIDCPILRKDFVIDAYQLYQAKIIGADAVLLIAAAIPKTLCDELTEQAHALGLEVLLELHSQEELDYITPQTDMIGVNNRHLGSFQTDVATSFQLAELLPKEAVLVSESGLTDPETVRRLQQVGYRGFLIGEHFMRSEQPGEALARFIEKTTQKTAV